MRSGLDTLSGKRTLAEPRAGPNSYRRFAPGGLCADDSLVVNNQLGAAILNDVSARSNIAS